ASSRLDFIPFVRVAARRGRPPKSGASPLGSGVAGEAQGSSVEIRSAQASPRSIRLAGYDYAAPGAYFVTIVVQGRECLLGDVTAEGTMRLSEIGKMAQAEWEALPTHFPRARLDACVVMPNHLHGIIVVERGMANVGRGEASAT